MVQEKGCNPHADIHTGSIGRCLRILDDAHDEHKEERQQHHHARKSMLLGKGRENEILMGHGEKAKLGLSSLGDSLAEHPARPYRYLGLNQLVAFALGVPLGIHKTHQPRLLIVRQEMLPTHRNHDDRHHGYGGHIPPTQSREKRTRNENREVRDRGAQVRLLQNQNRGNRHQARQLEHFPNLEHVRFQISQVAGY